MQHTEQLALDFEKFKEGLPKPLEQYILDVYGISLESVYGKHTIKNPFGKASGQLSLNSKQVERDVEAGLGFIVLKTVIAEDDSGTQSMSAWATQDTHMTVEEILGTRPEVAGEPGYTVTWKGRGWGGSLNSYLDLFKASVDLAAGETLIVPSCKYNLPKPEEDAWKFSEYTYTTAKLEEVWSRHSNLPMPLEKDFSPTLAGDGNFSKEKANILRWLENITAIIRNNASELSLGIKIFNASFEDDFQLEMLRTIEAASPDVLTYGNRLFDPIKFYEDKKGVAYGGPDLSARNLWAIDKSRALGNCMQISATGNIVSGKIMFEYLKRGCSTFQMHTLFQLPDRYFSSRGRNKTDRAIHHLLFDPHSGFLKYILEEKERLGWPDGITIGAIAEQYRDSYLSQ
jgi:dihydroorotate dehydrogenase